MTQQQFDTAIKLIDAAQTWKPATEKTGQKNCSIQPEWLT